MSTPKVGANTEKNMQASRCAIPPKLRVKTGKLRDFHLFHSIFHTNTQPEQHKGNQISILTAALICFILSAKEQNG
jgi:hypothetical protein